MRTIRVLKAIGNRLDVFAIVYLGGLFLIVGPGRGDSGWTMARALVWAFGFPGAYAWGVYIGRRTREKG